MDAYFHIAVLLSSHNTDYMDSLHEPVNTLARIWWWPPEDGSPCDLKYVGERILYDFNVFFNKYVQELVTIDTDFIDARFNYEILGLQFWGTERQYLWT